MGYRRTLNEALRRISPSLRERGRVIRRFSKQLGLVYFGTVNQHEDDHSALRGFTASLTHSDTHYSVGTFNGFDIRLVDRLDMFHTSGQGNHQQTWTILEIDLETPDVPHIFFVPTGKNGASYARLFSTQPHLLPLNVTLGVNKRSPEFHGRYQIMARPTHSHSIEHLFSSPIIVGIGTRFWPHGIEVQNGKLFVYLSSKKLTNTELQAALTSAFWLAEHIQETSLK
jgi:hypothetical protein